MGMMISEQEVKAAIGELKAPAKIRKALADAGIEFEDLTEMYGYFNLHVNQPTGEFVRIYEKKVKGRPKEIVTQQWEKFKFRPSGIPTFEPSGRKSF